MRPARSLGYAGASDRKLRLAWAGSEFRGAWMARKAPPGAVEPGFRASWGPQ